MRVCVVGAGLAGSLLAWRLRLAVAPLGERLDLELVAGAEAGDATDASLGLVRGFEPEPRGCRLAADSLAELHANPGLAAWSGLQQLGSVYVCARPPGPAARLALRLPGRARTAGADELAEGYGLAGLPDDCVAVLEPRAGAIVPGRLRRSVLAELDRLRVPRIPGQVDRVAVTGDHLTCRWDGRTSRYDAVVLATGRWTARLLAASGLPALAYRTKAITYGWYQATGAPRFCFVDETTGLYGRPVAGGRQLALGLPSTDWDVDPDRPSPDSALHARAAELALSRFPGMTLGPRQGAVIAADCYTESPGLALRPVLDSAPLYTFTGGSGGAVKTALAASAVAAHDLLTTVSGRGVPATSISQGRLT